MAASCWIFSSFDRSTLCLQAAVFSEDFSRFVLYLNETINCQHKNEYEDLLKEINEVLNEIHGKVQEIKRMMKVVELRKIFDEFVPLLNRTLDAKGHAKAYSEEDIREFFGPLIVRLNFLESNLSHCEIDSPFIERLTIILVYPL
ncbi:unnamed protein product [Haemonchus placei]|uniref:Uncharacterized protein n=1 Tax=Haemonchus placei TaxID=6290 RepID=A0A158QMQ6_HAEPC|nr:unnamed protein product [Haemonchus placei]